MVIGTGILEGAVAGAAYKWWKNSKKKKKAQYQRDQARDHAQAYRRQALEIEAKRKAAEKEASETKSELEKLKRERDQKEANDLKKEVGSLKQQLADAIDALKVAAPPPAYNPPQGNWGPYGFPPGSVPGFPPSSAPGFPPSSAPSFPPSSAPGFAPGPSTQPPAPPARGAATRQRKSRADKMMDARVPKRNAAGTAPPKKINKRVPIGTQQRRPKTRPPVPVSL